MSCSGRAAEQVQHHVRLQLEAGCAQQPQRVAASPRRRGRAVQREHARRRGSAAELDLGAAEPAQPQQLRPRRRGRAASRPTSPTLRQPEPSLLRCAARELFPVARAARRVAQAARGAASTRERAVVVRSAVARVDRARGQRSRDRLAPRGPRARAVAPRAEVVERVEAALHEPALVVARIERERAAEHDQLGLVWLWPIAENARSRL